MLTMDDFRDSERLAQRERELAASQRPAASMYTGMQHVYLMRGIKALKAAFGADVVDLRILSAGYGLIRADREICSYNVTFNNMSRPEARAWAKRLGVPLAVRDAVGAADLAVLLLGSRYLDAIDPPIAAKRASRASSGWGPTRSRPDRARLSGTAFQRIVVWLVGRARGVGITGAPSSGCTSAGR